MTFNEEYLFEKTFWGDCCNTFDEDQKHYIYAYYMGLEQVHYSFNVHNKKILDIGGGPSSILLKTINLKEGKVVDPIQYPAWTVDRYKIKNISVIVSPGEYISENDWDEVWIYNCLQHAEDPAKIIQNAKHSAPVLRIFEWINIPVHDGHPHELTKITLDNWIGGYGSTVKLAKSGCYGEAYYGVFTQ